MFTKDFKGPIKICVQWFIKSSQVYFNCLSTSFFESRKYSLTCGVPSTINSNRALLLPKLNSCFFFWSKLNAEISWIIQINNPCIINFPTSIFTYCTDETKSILLIKKRKVIGKINVWDFSPAIFTRLKSRLISFTAKSVWNGAICSRSMSKCFISKSCPSTTV